MAGDFYSIFAWWLLLFALGAIFLPVTSFLFRGFFDRGYALAKVIGIVAVSYFIWLLGSLKILPFASETAWLIVLAALAGNILLVKKLKIDLKKELRPITRLLIFEELLFFAALAFWSWVRGFQPAIEGLEKFMDFGFVNAILRSRFFPPADMWLAGETINYYYFGHLEAAVLTRLSGLDPAVAYNLLIATLFALTFTGGFSIGANLFWLNQKSIIKNQNENSRFKIQNALFKLRIKSSKLWNFIGNWSAGWRMGNWKLPIAAGLVSAFLLTIGGNLHPLYWYAKHRNFDSYWYPDATRFIVEQFGAADNTIHEFPIYSFVVADLHGHLINLPNVLLILALILALGALIRAKTDWPKLWPWLGALGLCLAVSFMANAWDYPIYLTVFGAVSLLGLLAVRPLVEAVIKTTAVCLAVLIPSLIWALPFHLNFENIAQGVAKTDFTSPPWMLAILWGWPLLLTIIWVAYLLISNKADGSNRTNLTGKLKRLFTLHSSLSAAHLFVLVLLAISWLLIAIPEFVYVKDIYIHTHQRANTMFKLTYQSFVMFSLVAGYILVNVLVLFKRKGRRLFLLIPVGFLVFFMLIYHRFAIKAYYGLTEYKGLDGLNFLQDFYPDDYQAILWLQSNITGQPVIAEAVGESYTDFARVSANTGLPTIVGWRVHEWLWRGSFDEAGKRTEEVVTIYESPDLRATKTLLNQYQVKYIFVGSLEREQYKNLQEAKFDQLGEAVFSSGETKIYRVN